MHTEKILHQHLALNWPSFQSVESPKTLVLGSFNPYFENGQTVDYYYGRESNFFWRVVADLLGMDQNYFFDSEDGLFRKLEAMQGRFVLADFINYLEITSSSKATVQEYIAQHIFKNFSDAKLWQTDSGNDDDWVYLQRSYNTAIYDFIDASDSLTTVIHTLGKSNLDVNKVAPAEEHLYIGFKRFISDIKALCRDKGISFVTESHSPSGRVISYPGESYDRLKEFYQEYLNL